MFEEHDTRDEDELGEIIERLMLERQSTLSEEYIFKEHRINN